MKNLGIILIIIGLLFASCSSKTGKVGNIDTDHISYIKDKRTGLCFAIIGAKKGDNFLDESTSIGLACVPCEEIEGKVEIK